MFPVGTHVEVSPPDSAKWYGQVAGYVTNSEVALVRVGGSSIQSRVPLAQLSLHPVVVATIAHRYRCEESEYTRKSLVDRDVEQFLDRRFLNKARILYFKPTARTPDFFYLSNEWDYAGYPKVNADVVVSFSNNVGWDQVVACNAERLVLCDYHEAPMLAHEMVFRPLFCIAKGPADFLCLLSGLTYSEDAKPKLPNRARWDHAALQLALADLHEQMSRGVDPAPLEDVHIQYLTRIAELDGEVPGLRRFFKEYYAALRLKLAKKDCEFPLPRTMRDASGNIYGDKSNRAAQFLWALYERYRRDASVGCLSSQDAFLKIKTVMSEGLQYCVGDINDVEMFKSITLGEGKSVVVNTSNVIAVGFTKSRHESPRSYIPRALKHIAVALKWDSSKVQRVRFCMGTDSEHAYQTATFSTNASHKVTVAFKPD